MPETGKSTHHQDGAPRISPWELGALAAAFLILLSPFIYLLRSGDRQIPARDPISFVGSEKCAPCHQEAYKAWQGSHHDLAMDLATEETVLGDFDNATFTDPYNQVTSRFFRENGKFIVQTEGPDGAPGTFTISHTFGVYPLQQYLVPFSGGRLQCLNIAWDVRKNAWYRLPPYQVKGPGDWLHWTRGGQTWNGMCAECHSTRLSKGYDLNTDSYTTTWFEIDVGCEACHGPGSDHIEWASHPAMGRPPASNKALSVETANLNPKKQTTLCAPCHSRRFQLGDNQHDQGELLDRLVPSLLEEGLYYPDGQILEEVYVYGSFTQSKMYQHGVRCSDCHNIHSLELHQEGNALCLQCHRKAVYDSPSHHFHKQEHQGRPSKGHLCVKCHMPDRPYMGIDERSDHSLRIPRPDLSLTIATPNSCSAKGCHGDKDLAWVNEHFTKWYGQSRKHHYGETIAAARAGTPEAAPLLRELAADNLLPAIVRATAVALLRNYPGDQTTDAFTAALQAEEALIRYTAIRSLNHLDHAAKVNLLAPKLYDKVRAVRMEAALALAPVPVDKIRADDHQALENGLEEYRSAMLYNSDFAPQRYNLGNLAAARGGIDTAVRYYLDAIAIDDHFYPAKVNLAMEYNRRGENNKAEQLLRQVVDQHPHLHEVAYSLGLLLAEIENYQDAALYLGMAADNMPSYTRARYNQALALLKLKRWKEGEQSLLKALEAEPANREYFMTLANLYLSFKKTDRAEQLAKNILAKIPDHAGARELLDLLREDRQR